MAITSIYRCLFLLALARCPGIKANDAATADSAVPKLQSVELAEAQIEWLRGKGGFYSTKIDINPLFESDSPQVPLGLFANKNIAKGERIMIVPRHALLTAGPESDDACVTTMNLIKERQLEDKSDFEPYVSYMFSKESVSLPSSWSAQGKELIHTIKGENLPPDDLTDVSFANDCDHLGTSSSEDKEFAYLTVVSRAWSDKLIPVFDMINHHSGEYANVDSTHIHFNSKDIIIHATQDIQAGGQLYLSYMECIDEMEYQFEYVLPQMLRDFGFVDAYPQRWIFPLEQEDDLVFDLGYADPEGSQEVMKVTWHTGEPSPKELKQLQKELQRVRSLRPYVTQEASQLESDYERKVSVDYYESLSLALQYATGNGTVTEASCSTMMIDGVCLSEEGADRELVTNGEADADGESESDQEEAEKEGKEWMACGEFWRIEDDYKLVDSFVSHYQEIDYFYGEEEDNACLYLDGYLHTCASTRPHYHEVFVHYAAHFVDQVKRVVFIGGGDSKVLHEVLKYPSLELVVGLELDQLVVRSSFKNLGTQPHWDNEKVEWYFGDAAKSYYGSFDLVIVDILTEVADKLQVNEELSLLDAAMLLMKPEGIIVKNEDQGYVPGSRSDSKFSVDLVFHDVPLYCLQVFVAGSNTVDFLTAEPKDHEIETLYLKGMEDFQSQFDSWHNYGVVSSQGNPICNKKEPTEPKKLAPSLGVLMILEAENSTTPLDSATTLTGDISNALQTVGLTVIDAMSNPLSVDGIEGYSIVAVAQEGYITARCFPALKYCAFDVQLYGTDIDKLANVKAELLGVVQSQQSSSYRFVTGGISGQENDDIASIGPPSVQELCRAEANDDQESETPRAQKVRKEKQAKDFDSPKPVTLHSYDNSLPLQQWQSQRPVGVQAFVQFKVPRFWVGEKVLISYNDAWLEGIIVRVRNAKQYDVMYKRGPRPQNGVPAERIQKSAHQLDKETVEGCLLWILNLVLQSADQEVTVQSMDASEMTGNIRDGLAFSFIWADGTAVATWDGRTKVAFNLFLSNAQVDLVKVFDKVILEQDPPLLTLATRDNFPRGIESVVNFAGDIGDETPVWA